MDWIIVLCVVGAIIVLVRIQENLARIATLIKNHNESTTEHFNRLTNDRHIYHREIVDFLSEIVDFLNEIDLLKKRAAGLPREPVSNPETLVKRHESISDSVCFELGGPPSSIASTVFFLKKANINSLYDLANAPIPVINAAMRDRKELLDLVLRDRNSARRQLQLPIES
jgi:hypothetical protein